MNVRRSVIKSRHMIVFVFGLIFVLFVFWDQHEEGITVEPVHEHQKVKEDRAWLSTNTVTSIVERVGGNDKNEEEKMETKETGVAKKLSLKTSPWIHRDSDYSKPTQHGQVKYVYWYPQGLERYWHPAFTGCHYKCENTMNASAADMVAIEGKSMIQNPLTRDALWPRPPHQTWLFTTVDPVNDDFGLDNGVFKHLFNFTSTHRLDSDIPQLLGMLTKRSSPRTGKNYTQIYRGKTKLAAWFVSHCFTNSRREVYVERMTKIAPVDVFGKCGPFKCGDDHYYDFDHQLCFPMLSRNYKFYLALENSLCDDYVSEKFFKLFVDLDVIPVVRGSVDYDNAFPKQTFVNAADYPSPEALMKYLVDLGNDEQAFVKMLQEKDKWELTKLDESLIQCKICKFLHTNTAVRTIADISKAITGPSGALCHEAKDLQ